MRHKSPAPITASHTLKFMWVEIPRTLTWLTVDSHRLGKGDRTKEIKRMEMVLFYFEGGHGGRDIFFSLFNIPSLVCYIKGNLM